MAFTQWLPIATRTPGTINFGPVNVPNGLTRVSIRVTSTSWTQPDRTITLTLEASLDNEASWVPFGVTKFVGGDVFQKDGVTPGFRQRDVIFNPNAYPTDIRGSFVVAGGNIDAGIDREIV